MPERTPIRRYEDWRAARYFPGLDGLRAIAALLVVFHHARTHRLWGVLEGWNGVTLFFVLSGFLITTLALREEDERGALRWRAFFVRRGFRILPVYLASLALYAAAMFGCVLAFLLHDRRTFPVVARLGSNAGFVVAATMLVAVHASTHLWHPTAEGFRVSSAAYYLPYSLAAALVVGSLALRSRPGI